MNHFQRKLFNHLKENFDINSEIDFFDEGHSQQIEIIQDNFFCEINLYVWAKMDQEIGGEDDEVLFIMKDKSVEIQTISLWHTNIGTGEDIEIEVTESFKDNITKVLNSQIHED